MKVIIDDDEISNLYEGLRPKGKPKYQESTIKKLKKTIKILEMCDRKETLMRINGLNFEALVGHKNLYSARVDDRFRLEITFEIENIPANMPPTNEYIVIIRMSNHYQ